MGGLWPLAPPGSATFQGILITSIKIENVYLHLELINSVNFVYAQYSILFKN